MKISLCSVSEKADVLSALVYAMNLKNEKRNIGRRKEDFTLREQNERFHKLCEVGKTITAEMDIKMLFPLQEILLQ